MSKTIRRTGLLILALATAAAALQFAGHFSATAFRVSLEDRLLLAAGANHTRSEPFFSTGPPWRQDLILAPATDHAASAGLDSPMAFFPGRIRALFVFEKEGAPQKGAAGRIEIRLRKSDKPLAVREFGPEELRQGNISLEAEIGPRAARLEFWLYFSGPGRLAYKRVELSRPGGWPAVFIRAAGSFIREPLWAWWGDKPFRGPWRDMPLREVVRRVTLLELAGRLTENAGGPAQSAIGLFRFVADRVGGFPGRLARPNLGDSAWDVLVRGGGQCDEQAVVMGRLLACLGMPSRVLSGSFHPAAPGGHSILEAFLPTGPAVFDPYLRLCFTGGDGAPLGLEALRAKTDAMAANPLFASANPDFQAKVRAFFRNPVSNLAFIGPMLTGYGKLPGPIRRLWAGKVVQRYLNDLQSSLGSDPALAHLARARVLHLLGRLAPARKYYQKALEASSLPEHRRAVQSYLAWLDLDQGRKAQACELAAKLTRGANDFWAARAEVLADRAGCGL